MFVWPRRSLWRSVQYYTKRVLRLTATPHAIAAGVAAGVFASFTPYLGFHFILAAVLAWGMRGNLLAAAFGTAVGNPLTFPLIWGATLGTGKFILYGHHPGEIATMHLGEMMRHLDFAELWQPVLKPMTVGALPLGLLFGLGFYIATRWAIIGFRERRRLRLADRARRRAAIQQGMTAGG